MLRKLFLLSSIVIVRANQEDASSFDNLICSEKYPTSCNDVLHRGYNVSDIYFIQPKGTSEPFLVSCDLEHSGGGWTTILNRFDGSQNFNRNWESYKEGIGHLGGEFWLGLEKLYYITRYEVHEVLFELEDWANVRKDAHYKYFGIGSEKEGYVLKLLAGYSGSAGDGFTLGAGLKFSTLDRDNDLYAQQCTTLTKGGWWYGSCGYMGPTGVFGNSSDYSGIWWHPWHAGNSIKSVKMLIRPRGKKNHCITVY